MVEAVAEVVEAGLGIVVLRREAVAEEAGERTGLGDDVPEGAVGVPGDRVSVRIEVARDVAVRIVAFAS